MYYSSAAGNEHEAAAANSPPCAISAPATLAPGARLALDLIAPQADPLTRFARRRGVDGFGAAEMLPVRQADPLAHFALRRSMGAFSGAAEGQRGVGAAERPTAPDLAFHHGAPRPPPEGIALALSPEEIDTFTGVDETSSPLDWLTRADEILRERRIAPQNKVAAVLPRLSASVRQRFHFTFGPPTAWAAAALSFLTTALTLDFPDAVSWEDFWLWLLAEYLRPAHHDAVRRQWADMGGQATTLARLESDTVAFNRLLLRADMMEAILHDDEARARDPRIVDTFERREVYRGLLPPSVIAQVVYLEASRAQGGNVVELTLFELQDMAITTAQVQLRGLAHPEPGSLSCSRTGVPDNDRLAKMEDEVRGLWEDATLRVFTLGPPDKSLSGTGTVPVARLRRRLRPADRAVRRQVDATLAALVPWRASLQPPRTDRRAPDYTPLLAFHQLVGDLDVAVESLQRLRTALSSSSEVVVKRGYWEWHQAACPLHGIRAAGHSLAPARPRGGVEMGVEGSPSGGAEVDGIGSGGSEEEEGSNGEASEEEGTGSGGSEGEEG